jgi:aliphatic nitrilase
MSDEFPRARLAAVQAAPVWMDREATVAKACRLIEEAADNGANVIGFPEGFVPGFPDWYMWYIALSQESLRFSKELFKNAIEVPGPATEAIGAAARKTRTHVVIGVNERRAGSLGTLYNAQLFFGPDGDLLGVHRKLMPTATERLVHAAGDGSGLKTYDTPYGRLGGLICGENTSSLARFSLLAQDERIHVMSWPAFPSGKRNFDTIDIRARYHAFEGRVFVISACGIFDDACLDAMSVSAEQRAAMNCRGGHSGIIGPNGNYISGPADDTAQIVYGDADMDRIIEGKLLHDIIGHYNRFDIFDLRVNVVPQQPMQKADLAGSEAPQSALPLIEDAVLEVASPVSSVAATSEPVTPEIGAPKIAVSPAPKPQIDTATLLPPAGLND